LLPFWFLFGISNLLYYLVYHVFKYRKAVVRKNLTNSFPNKSLAEIISIEKKFYRYFADLMVEILKMNSMSKAEITRRVQMKNFDLVEGYFARGESALACAGHYGNWELGMMAAGIYFSATANVIYKPLSNKVFETWFTNLRTRFGNVFVPMRQTLRQVVATQKEVTLFCFASDQTPRWGEVQYTLDFLNQPTPVLMGLEKIAVQTNRPVFYFSVKRPKRGYYEVDCIPLAMVPKETKEHEITTLFFKHLAADIENEPAYWLWSHKRWKLNG
jgi:Kdo2-lipid IVA lauroyltransferase/acyltransferase